MIEHCEQGKLDYLNKKTNQTAKRAQSATKTNTEQKYNIEL